MNGTIRGVARAVEYEAPRDPMAPTAEPHRWWELALACGHTVKRDVRYTRGARPGKLPRPILPAPQRVRCDQCPQDQR